MAKVFLKPGESFTLASNNTHVYASSGLETVTLLAGVTGFTADQNLDKIVLPGTTSAYTYQQMGNQLKVFSGVNLVATLVVQTDLDGTLLTFANGTVEVKLSLTGPTAGQMTLGGAVVNPNEPTSVNPTQFLAGQTSGAMGNLVHISGPGTTLNNTASNQTFVIAAGNYTHTINGFNAGDKIDFPDGATPTVINASFTDGQVELHWAKSGQSVKVIVTGVGNNDAQLSTIAGWNEVYGPGTII